MSFSFTVAAADKAAAKAAAAAKFDEAVVAYQPMHARDRAAVLANVNAVVDLLADDDTKNVSVSCSGYLSWSGPTESPVISTASISCSATHAVRVTA